LNKLNNKEKFVQLSKHFTLKNRKHLKKLLKIIGFYVFSVLCLGLFFYMDNSQQLNEFLEDVARVRIDWGFEFHVIVGIIKMTTFQLQTNHQLLKELTRL
jgi:hypothetical protein